LTKSPSNVWQFLFSIVEVLTSHGTRLLGVAQGTIAVIAGMDGIIPATHLKYYLGVSAVLTYLRGQANATKIKTLSARTRRRRK